MADTYGISACDAMYLELAVRMHLPLATLDQRLRAAGRSAGVEVLGIDVCPTAGAGPQSQT